MIRGSIGDSTCSVEFVKDLKDEEGGDLVGLCVNDSRKGHVRISLDPEQSGLGLFNTVIHEATHGGEYVFGIEMAHGQVYVIASALCQFLVSTGLIDPAQFEAKLRLLMANAAEKP